MQMRPSLIIMVKAPRIGAVKTRLAREIGAVAAWAAYRVMAGDTCRRLGADPRWRTFVSVTPDRPDTLPEPCRHLEIRPQGQGDLGTRMQRIFDKAPPGPAVIVGSDIPAVTPAHIAHAFRLLGGADCVFGPADDGGFWLVGANTVPRTPRLFDGVRWSRPDTLRETLKNARGLNIALADRLSDVDDEAAWRAWRGWRANGGAMRANGAP